MIAPDPASSSDAIAGRRRHLLAWYDQQGRNLPWRRQTSLYGTWVAETMLQQTTVAAVQGRWEAFLAHFPDVQALAAASSDAVLAAWSGLGYYGRARRLHQAARWLVEHCGGRLPRTYDGWRRLPGVGDYAAGAIASIGLQLPVVAIDANVRRVLTRWHCSDPVTAAALTAARLQDLAQVHLSVDRPGDWNQALMDLGAGPCRAGRADCPRCPVRPWCAAGLAGTTDAVPAALPRAATQPVCLGALVLQDEQGILLLPSEQAVVTRPTGLGHPVRDDLSGLFTGLRGLPSTPWYAIREGSDPGTAFQAAWRRWLRGLGWSRPLVTSRGWHRHTITVYRLRVEVTSAIWPSEVPLPDLDGAVWARLQGDRRPAVQPLTEQPLASLARRSLERALGVLSTKAVK